jgi:hypothetical protein
MITARIVHFARVSGVYLVTGLLAGCMTQPSIFVDGSLKDAHLSQIEKLERPRPTQLSFAFKTRGLVDTRNSKMLESDVSRAVASSGLFSSVDTRAVLGGAVLNVTIESFPHPGKEIPKALASGFLTLGLIGSTEKIPLICTVDYIASDGSGKLTTTTEHAIYVPYGVVDFRPKNMVMVSSWGEALHAVARQSVTAALTQLAHSSEFRKEAQDP